MSHLRFPRSRRVPRAARVASALALALVLAALASFAVPACDSDTTGELDPTSLEGLISLGITPPAAVLEGPFGQTISQRFSAIGSFSDGSSRDVTALVTWSTDVWGALVDVGVFASSLPGKGTVSAQVAGLSAVATVSVKITGDATLAGTPTGAATALAGSPSPAFAPGIAYPLDGALFPANLGDTELQLTMGDASQSVGRIDVVGELVDLHVFGPCMPIVAAQTGCGMILEDALVPTLAAASQADEMSVRVRLAASDGTALGESAPIDVRWTFTEVRGGLYYWSARDNGPTYIFRYDLDQKGAPPAQFFSNGESPPLHDGTQTPCVGCHAISDDGRKMGMSFGGSDPSDFQLLDVATKAPIAVRNTDPAGFATFSALSPHGDWVATSFRGELLVRSADASLAELATLASAATAGEALSQPFWSADGQKLAYVGWVPGQNGASASSNGDVVRGAQIFVTELDGTTVSTTSVVVPRTAGRSSYYPAISDDGQWLVFDQSRCDGPAGFHPYGNDACDGYDDASAQVFVAPIAGGTPVALARLNGSDTFTNSWPRWSPSHGSFRGKSIYFVAFSTKRPYGLRLAGSNDGSTPPQLWIAAVALEPGEVPGPGDPSFAPVWLPLQDDDMDNPTGNHVPQWAAAALPIPN